MNRRQLIQAVTDWPRFPITFSRIGDDSETHTLRMTGITHKDDRFLINVFDPATNDMGQFGQKEKDQNIWVIVFDNPITGVMSYYREEPTYKILHGLVLDALED